MRTSVDIPDALLEQVRPRLKAEGLTLREVVLTGLRRFLLADGRDPDFHLRDAAFTGEVGFAGDFAASRLGEAIRADAEARSAAEEHRDCRP